MDDGPEGPGDRVDAVDRATVAVYDAHARTYAARRTPLAEDRARALVAAADALGDHAEELIELAMAETGLTRPRLTGELKRTAVQLKLFADVVADGSYLDVRVDDRLVAVQQGVDGLSSDMRRVKPRLDPVDGHA